MPIFFDSQQLQQSAQQQLADETKNDINSKITHEMQVLWSMWSKYPTVPRSFINDWLQIIQKIETKELDPSKFLTKINDTDMLFALPNLSNVRNMTTQVHTNQLRNGKKRFLLCKNYHGKFHQMLTPNRCQTSCQKYHCFGIPIQEHNYKILSCIIFIKCCFSHRNNL